MNNTQPHTIIKLQSRENSKFGRDKDGGNGRKNVILVAMKIRYVSQDSMLNVLLFYLNIDNYPHEKEKLREIKVNVLKCKLANNDKCKNTY